MKLSITVLFIIVILYEYECAPYVLNPSERRQEKLKDCRNEMKESLDNNSSELKSFPKNKTLVELDGNFQKNKINRRRNDICPDSQVLAKIFKRKITDYNPFRNEIQKQRTPNRMRTKYNLSED